MAESLKIDIEPETKIHEKAHTRTGRFNEKISSLESIFLISNFILEIPSAIFDQLSSVHKPQFALLSMIISFTVFVISIIDLIYKGKRERVSLMKKGFLPWFYSPYPNPKPFGTFPDIIGLICAFFQWVFASIAFVFLSRHSDNPIKVSTWPIFFAFGLLYAKLSGNLLQKNSASNLRKLHREKEFTFAELSTATDDFSDNSKLDDGRYGIVYKGRLEDGRDVVIKRKYIAHRNIEEDSAYESELAYYLRLHHKHLVGVVGYCEQETERLTVFEYMANESLYNQLFLKDNRMIDSWVIRIKIALDASRGIDYLHNYAVPPIIHRAINSTCFLLDSNWTARISDFGLMGLESEQEYKSSDVYSFGYVDPECNGYVDPECNGENFLTAKSDVYSFGVVLIELLTGKMAIFDKGKNLVEYSVPKILGNELDLILDHRVGPPGSVNEGEAVKMVASTAVNCVNSDGSKRPIIANIVNNLEQAFLKITEESNGGKDDEIGRTKMD